MEGSRKVEEDPDDGGGELDVMEVDEPTGETTGLEVPGMETDGLELAVLDAVDDGVTAGGV